MKTKIFLLLILLSFTAVDVMAQKNITRNQTKTTKTQQNKATRPKKTKKSTAPGPTLGTSTYTPKVSTYTANGVSFQMVEVRGGTFTMGATSEQSSDAWDIEKPAHSVTLSSYSIGQTEVTQALWEAVMGETVSQIATRNGWRTRGVGGNYPMYYVSWEDCQEFVRKLNQLTGKNFRLPTEAEWEYSARGGSKSRGYKYSGSNTLGSVGWYEDNSGSTTHPVASTQANELGLYDMSGNVWEWCQDWYEDYSSSSQTNPMGPYSGSFRVFRGGSWNDVAWYCRVSYRSYSTPSYRYDDLGLRLALSE